MESGAEEEGHSRTSVILALDHAVISKEVVRQKDLRLDILDELLRMWIREGLGGI